jgi:hypothetical protein
MQASIIDLYWSSLEHNVCVPDYVDVDPLEHLIEKESRRELFDCLFSLSTDELHLILDEQTPFTQSLSYYKRRKLYQSGLNKIHRKLIYEFGWDGNCNWNLGTM